MITEEDVNVTDVFVEEIASVYISNLIHYFFLFFCEFLIRKGIAVYFVLNYKERALLDKFSYKENGMLKNDRVLLINYKNIYQLITDNKPFKEKIEFLNSDGINNYEDILKPRTNINKESGKINIKNQNPQ